MRKKLAYLIASAVLFVALFAWVFLSLQETDEGQAEGKPTESVEPSREDSSEEPQQDAIESVQERPDYAKLLKAILNSKIVFYGQVLDQNDEPVIGATVKFSMLGVKEFAQVWEGAGNYRYVDTDQNGRFEIRGKGGTLYASAYHDDYYRIAESGDSFTYGMPSGREPARDPDNPAILRLHKKGETEPILYSGNPYKGISITPDRRPLVLNLETADRVPGYKELILEYWQSEDSEHRDWQLSVSVNNGEVQERRGRFNFIAPAEGYKEACLLLVEEELEKGDGFARGGIDRHFFARFTDGTYGRFKISLRTADSPFLSLESWINPSGSRNLEYDPDKQINYR